MRLGLVVVVNQDSNALQAYLERHLHYYDCASVAQIGAYCESIDAELRRLPPGRGHYTTLPYPRTFSVDEKTRLDVECLCAGFSAGFDRMRDVDYVVAITGDTFINDISAVYRIMDQMYTDSIACSRAMGMEVGGRVQDDSNRDFMPNLFIVKENLIPRLCDIKITNPLSIAQCLGDAVGDAPMFVYSHTPYGRPVVAGDGKQEIVCYRYDNILMAIPPGQLEFK